MAQFKILTNSTLGNNDCYGLNFAKGIETYMMTHFFSFLKNKTQNNTIETSVLEKLNNESVDKEKVKERIEEHPLFIGS